MVIGGGVVGAIERDEVASNKVIYMGSDQSKVALHI